MRWQQKRYLLRQRAGGFPLGVDVIAPVLSAPDVNLITQTTARADITTNEAGGLVYYVSTQSATPPGKAQVKLGQDENSASADFADDVAASVGVNSIDLTAHVAATAYHSHWMHEDAAGNQSDVATFGPWVTSAADSPGAGVLAHDSNGGGRTPVFTVSGLAAAGAIEGNTVRIYQLVEPTGVTFTEYVNAAISAGDIIADEIQIAGVTLLNDALYQSHARIQNASGLGDLSNEVEFAINTALTLTLNHGSEVTINTGFSWTVEGGLVVDDRVVWEADQDSAFGSVDETGSMIFNGTTLIDDTPVNALGPLVNGLTNFHCYRERVGADDTDYSNSQSTTINAVTQATRLGAGGYPEAA